MYTTLLYHHDSASDVNFHECLVDFVVSGWHHSAPSCREGRFEMWNQPKG